MIRKASTPVDWAVGAVFFILLVAFSFYYMMYVVYPTQPYEAVLKNAAEDVAARAESNVTWILKKTPVTITSAYNATWPMGAYFRLPDSAYPSTLSVIDGKGNRYVRASSGNIVSWSAPLSAGKNYYYILYSDDLNLAEYNYTTDVSVTGARINNSLISVNFSSAGQESMIYRGSEFFFGDGMLLGTSTVPAITNNTAYAEANYTNGVSAKMYSNISKVAVYSNHTMDVAIKLSTNFTNFYAGGSTYSFGGGSYDGITDFVDAYNASSNGLAVIGSAINFSVSDKGTYREILLYNATRFEIYAHEGGYANAVAENNTYFSPPTYVIGVSSDTSGVSAQRFSELSVTPYAALKENMGIKGVGFQVLFNETENYAAIPHNTNVIVVKHPIAVLDRFGGVTQSYMGVAVWSEK